VKALDHLMSAMALDYLRRTMALDCLRSAMALDYLRSAMALDYLRRTMTLDYIAAARPTRLIHPFDRFLVPFLPVLTMQLELYGQKATAVDTAHALIALPKKVSPQSLDDAFDGMRGIYRLPRFPAYPLYRFTTFRDKRRIARLSRKDQAGILSQRTVFTVASVVTSSEG